MDHWSSDPDVMTLFQLSNQSNQESTVTKHLQDVHEHVMIISLDRFIPVHKVDINMII